MKRVFECLKCAVQDEDGLGETEIEFYPRYFYRDKLGLVERKDLKSIRMHLLVVQNCKSHETYSVKCCSKKKERAKKTVTVGSSRRFEHTR